MLFLQKSNIVFFLFFGGVTRLTRTNAFLPRLPSNDEGHKTSFYNTAKKERISNFQQIGVGKNSHVTKISAATTDDDSGKEAKLLGTLVLLTVPLSWGTYVPVGECRRLGR